MNNLLSILAEAAPAAGAVEQSSGGMNMMFMMLLLLGAMYFFMIAPQKKKQKQHMQMIENLQTGDSIITIGGIYGKITNKTDKTFIIKVSESAKIEILKSAVSSKIDEAPVAAAATEENK